MDANAVNVKFLSVMMLICTKQHQNNIWSSIHEKVNQHWVWVEKKNEAYKKSFQVISFRCLQVTCRTTERSVIKDVF